MKVLNVEIKACSSEHERIRDILKARNADFRGRDRQVDSFFNVSAGRLKLREGEIENNLIYYDRPDIEGPRTSRCMLHATGKNSELKEILTASLGVHVVVEKEREIWFIDNIKIHLDTVGGLGSFVEIEAQSKEGDLSEDYLREQCSGLMEDFGIKQSDLISDSYSDIVLAS